MRSDDTGKGQEAMTLAEASTCMAKSSSSSGAYFISADEIKLLPILLYNAPAFVRESNDAALKAAYRKAAPSLYRKRYTIGRLEDIIKHFQDYGISPQVTRQIIESALEEYCRK